MKIFLSKRTTIATLLILQIIPLLMFPLKTYSLSNQEWWLGVLLSIMAVVGSFQIMKRSVVSGPWYLINFAQGFNIISRLLTLFPHIMVTVDGKDVYNSTFIVISVFSMAFSAFMIWYAERPDVRIGMLRE
jgi:hypothetical protein